MSEKILVFPEFILGDMKGNIFFDVEMFMQKIENNFTFLDRDKVEHDIRYRQVIPYSIFRHRTDIFYYKRSTVDVDNRLKDSWSIGVGGHINVDDGDKQTKLFHIIELARDREIFEEFGLKSLPKPNLKFVLNDKSDEIGKVHVGFVYEYWLPDKNIVITPNREIAFYGFAQVEEILLSLDNYESWSKIIINDYLSSKI